MSQVTERGGTNWLNDAIETGWSFRCAGVPDNALCLVGIGNGSQQYLDAGKYGLRKTKSASRAI